MAYIISVVTRGNGLCRELILPQRYEYYHCLYSTRKNPFRYQRFRYNTDRSCVEYFDSKKLISRRSWNLSREMASSKIEDDFDDGSLNIPKKDQYYLDPTNAFIQKMGQQNHILASHKPGALHPSQNRFHQPIVYHPHYSFSSWPSEKQTFPMTKFYHLAKALNTKHSKSKLPRPLVRDFNDYYTPLEAHEIPRAWIAQPTSVICPTFLDRFISGTLSRSEELKIGFRESTKMPKVIERTLLEVGGTILSAQLAYHYGLATNCAGGTHHASPTGGAGYTIINDLAVTANFLLKPELNGGTITDVHKVLVIDCDVHQGDGTAKFVQEGIMKKEQFVTLSLHCESNYPTLKAKSTYDVGLPDEMEDKEYLNMLKESVTRALDEQHPDFVLYDAGVDVHKDDFLGRLNLTDEGIWQRDVWVFETCIQRDIPVAGVIGGGYDKDSLTLARRHSIVHEAAAYVWRKYRLWENTTL